MGNRLTLFKKKIIIVIWCNKNRNKLELLIRYIYSLICTNQLRYIIKTFEICDRNIVFVCTLAPLNFVQYISFCDYLQYSKCDLPFYSSLIHTWFVNFLNIFFVFITVDFKQILYLKPIKVCIRSHDMLKNGHYLVSSRC